MGLWVGWEGIRGKVGEGIDPAFLLLWWLPVGAGNLLHCSLLPDHSVPGDRHGSLILSRGT